MLDFAELTGVADQVWRAAGLTPEDIDLAILYDHFTPMVRPTVQGASRRVPWAKRER